MKSKNLKQQKLNTKSNSGITLVALIITIVVLLILAIVAIGAVKDSKIITHAQNAGESYTVAQEKEQLGLALSEWNIEKAIPENTKTFKEVITNALQGQNVNITGEENGPLTVTFNNTGNAYTVTKEGEITTASKPQNPGGDGEKGEDIIVLEQYLFGDSLNGKNFLTEVSSDGVNYNKNEELGIDVGDINGIGMINRFKEWVCYIEYAGSKYKFKTDSNGRMPINTIQSYGVTRIDNWDVESKVGKYVKDENNAIWRIIYDDDTHGLQMISTNTYLYKDSNFNLGYNDTLITEWTTLNTETEEFKLADLNGNKALDDNLEKSIYSYNQAVETLNTACENLFKDENGNYTKTYIQDVRCVGSNPMFVNKDNENKTTCTSELFPELGIWPENSESQAVGLFSGKGYGTENNYEADYDRMLALNINASNSKYWLASRLVGNNAEAITFNILNVTESGECNFNYYAELCKVSDSKIVENNKEYSLRPIISLSSSIEFSGSGTAEDPYTFK